MTGLDAERYLRATGEQWAREGGGTDWSPRNPVLAATGAAPVAVDALTIASTRALIGEYDPGAGVAAGVGPGCRHRW